ncbi:MAG: MBL fold metallo-hydrolase [Planctomycetota bacterium]|nr:MAG: MBL fold metallo-hydrolase [Planctomycetota bacterium]
MRVQFLGAVRSVTGSMHVIEANGKRVLLECGLYQGKRKEAMKRNRELPFDATGIDVCTLTHAHIDHSGNLPNLVKSGFRGRIHATAATADLAKALLLDSANIQAQDVAYLNRKARKSDPTAPLVEPIYTEEDAREACRRFQLLDYHQPTELCPGIRVTHYDAGHILGSAVSVYEVEEGGRTVRIGFTGDLGRPYHPILRDPEPLPPIDYLITESTYGDRTHEAVGAMKSKLRDVVRETFERGGRVIIPAFAVGRTQNVVYTLAQLFHEGELPRVPVFVDSPLAVDATKVYRDHPECYDVETRQLMESMGHSPLGFDLLTYTRSTEESKALNFRKGPCVIIAASGMCEAGRILHHLKHGLIREENTVLIVGYQAEGTLGRKLIEGEPRVRIFRREYRVKARIVKLNGFSAHADRDELSTWIKHVDGVRQVFVVHGEEAASLAFAATLEGLGLSAHVPTPLESVEL